MRNFKTLSVLLLTSLLFTACFDEKDKKSAAAGQQRQMPPSKVDVFVAKKSNVPISFDYTATLTSQQDVIIYPKVSGTIIKQFFKPGDSVKAGDKLFLIDPEKYQAGYDALEAAIGVANANLKNAQTEFNRISNLYKKNAVSQKDYDAAVSALEIANANLLSARANAKNAKIDLSYTSITAPFDGVLGDNLADVGSLVVANSTQLVRLTKINPIEAHFYISDVDNLNRVKMQESSLWVQTNSGAVLKVGSEEFNGKVNFIDNVVNTNMGSVLAKAEFNNDEGKLLPGMFGHIKMDGFYQKDGFKIPQVALQQTDVKTYVLVVSEGKVASKDVKITYQTKDAAVVSEGLNEGDKIIMNNFLKIGVGAPVEIDKDLTESFGKSPDLTPRTEQAKKAN
ncbi:efflux transporter, RND family, MFP subunit [Campylobacter rectus RM3267]|uniref:Multidrug efflux system CmeABC, periplasmic fusion protein CmeA n=2 Tax=Campylobacter rectus TaxID=203 RepID=A0A6G5QQX5_CAMRE|nr:efflux RND transporter periplasmic adaptor subunit [Campylobacter rectus]EEF13762.1 efflux transporter, RND family, MFP subunit [Campylobacter rectus RM3267]QCD47856.1 multidrug efflux system CmeABC, periplasmic fusion protein CmeA [Campylobacter rectus]UEB48550.1 efflux RND transporter periplasmic adaptor subunit [Campylobacter rectus]